MPFWAQLLLAGGMYASGLLGVGLYEAREQIRRAQGTEPIAVTVLPLDRADGGAP